MFDCTGEWAEPDAETVMDGDAAIVLDAAPNGIFDAAESETLIHIALPGMSFPHSGPIAGFHRRLSIHC